MKTLLSFSLHEKKSYKTFGGSLGFSVVKLREVYIELGLERLLGLSVFLPTMPQLFNKQVTLCIFLWHLLFWFFRMTIQKKHKKLPFCEFIWPKKESQITLNYQILNQILPCYLQWNCAPRSTPNPDTIQCMCISDYIMGVEERLQILVVSSRLTQCSNSNKCAF